MLAKSSDSVTLPVGGTQYEYAELNLEPNYQKFSPCEFLPFGDAYNDEGNMFGRREYRHYWQALNLLGEAGWEVAAAISNLDKTTKLILKRKIGQARSEE